jgi:hypothetical protein
VKHREYEKRKREKEAANKHTNGASESTAPSLSPTAVDEEVRLTDDEASDAEEEESTVSRKRKEFEEEGDDESNKRIRIEGDETPIETPPPPPPPPPPPVEDGTPVNGDLIETEMEESGQNGYHADRDEMLGSDELVKKDAGLDEGLQDRRTLIDGT